MAIDPLVMIEEAAMHLDASGDYRAKFAMNVAQHLRSIAPPPPQPKPTLTRLVPTTGASGMPIDVTLTGSNFTKGDAKPQVDGMPLTWKGTPTDSSGVVSITSSSAKTVKVTVKNDGGESDSQDFELTAPAPQAPTLTAISPTTAEADA